MTQVLSLSGSTAALGVWLSGRGFDDGPEADAAILGRLPGCFREPLFAGEGALARVHRVWDTTAGEHVAVKIPRVAARRASDVFELYRREYELLRSVDHPGVVHAHDLIYDFEAPCLVLEYVDGLTLERWLEHHGAVPPDAAAVELERLAAPLAALHERGIIHHDVSTRNYLRRRDGKVKLCDLGLAERVSPAAGRPSPRVLGTPVFTAPELFDGGAATFRSDVFSLGAVMYSEIAGEHLFQPESFGDLRAAHTTLDDLVLDALSRIPPPLGALLSRCLARRPAARYADAGDVVAALENLEE